MLLGVSEGVSPKLGVPHGVCSGVCLGREGPFGPQASKCQKVPKECTHQYDWTTGCWTMEILENLNLLKLRSLDPSCPFFLSDNSIWGQWPEMLQML